MAPILMQEGKGPEPVWAETNALFGVGRKKMGVSGIWFKGFYDSFR
jgi:hypothetical protein